MSITEVVHAVREVGIVVPSQIAAVGRIGKTVITMRDHFILGSLTGISTSTDAGRPEAIREVRLYYNRKTREFAIIAEAFGGLIELSGVVP